MASGPPPEVQMILQYRVCAVSPDDPSTQGLRCFATSARVGLGLAPQC